MRVEITGPADGAEDGWTGYWSIRMYNGENDLVLEQHLAEDEIEVDDLLDSELFWILVKFLEGVGRDPTRRGPSLG